MTSHFTANSICLVHQLPIDAAHTPLAFPFAVNHRRRRRTTLPMGIHANNTVFEFRPTTLRTNGINIIIQGDSAGAGVISLEVNISLSTL